MITQKKSILSICISMGFGAFLFFGSVYAQVCSVDLGTSEVFEPTPVWVGQYVDGRETTLVGDVDGDGMPEVVADNYGNPGIIYVLDGQTGATEHAIPTGKRMNQNNSSNAIADVDRNGYGEIYFVDFDRKLYRWDFDGTNWSQTWEGPDLVRSRLYAPHIADFDQDGTPEIYMGSQIYRVSDGALLMDSGINPGDLGGSNAFDILPDNFVFVDGPRAGTTCADCDGLELAVGSRVYTIDIATSTITLATEHGTNYVGRGGDALADMDNDGDVDIVYGFSIGGDAHLLIRDGQTSEEMMVYEVNASGAGIGRPNIADFDGDGCNEVGVVTRLRYSIIDDIYADDAGCPGENFTSSNTNTGGSVLWLINNSDGSAITGSSVFDFDLDGEYEVVYRDQTNLFILAGPDGDIKFSSPCTSGTRRENPVIADVNNDGQTEIMVACTGGGGSVRGIVAFTSASDPWAPSRPVRNQHGYNVTNVNDDLTIPIVEKYNPTRAGGVHDNFMTQSLPINSDFTLKNDILQPGHIFAADAELGISAVDTSQCAVSMTVQVDVSNNGDASLPASTPLAVYNDDPTVFASSLIGSTTLGMVVGTGSTVTVSVPVTSCVSPLFAVINDGSTTNPYTLSGSTVFPNTSTAECDYTNNIDSVVFSHCGDGILDTGEECDDPKICNNGNACTLDIDCDVDITDGLVLHHQFQGGSTTDLSGNGNDGILMGDAKIVNGLTDESLTVDGYDDWMMVPHSTSLDLSTDITLAAWVYPRQFGHGQGAGDFSNIITKGAAYYLNLDASGRPQFYRYGLSNEGYHTASNPLPLNTRSHIAATYNGTAGEIRFYVDGVVQFVTSATGLGRQNTQNVGIGRYPGYDVRELDGALDDVRVYDRPLVETEIQQLHSNGLDMCESNTLSGDGCSNQCEIEYCRDDAPLTDTSKNFVITSLDPTSIAGTSSQPDSKVAICLEDTAGTRDIFYTTTDATGAFDYTPNLTPYAAPRVNVGVMLHDEDGLDIDHHALILKN